MPVYAPALVAFTVVEDNLVRGRREPAVAWFPLGPRESYRPAYAASPRYIRAINYNITNVTSNAYANRHVSGAITAVPASAFTRAQPVRRAALALPRERMAQAPVLAAPEVQARHESLASHLTGGHRPAPALLARPAMTHMRPAVAHAPQQVGGAAPQFQRGPQPPAAGPLDQRLPPHLVAGVATPQFHPRDMAGRPDHMAADRGAPAVPAIPRPDHEAERRAMQMMRQPGPQAQPAAPRNWPQHGQPAPRQAHDTTAPEQHAPPMPHPPHQPPVGAPHLVNEAPALPQHPSPPYAQAHMQPAPHPVPMPAAHEPPRGQPQHAQAPAHAEPMHAQPAPHWAPPQAPHQAAPHWAPPQAAHQAPPHPAPPQAAHEQPHPAPPRPVHEAPPPPAAHASPPPHQEPPHAEHAPPAQGGPHPAAAPGKDGPEHGQHGHKDEHH
jgi:hypothetical protein